MERITLGEIGGFRLGQATDSQALTGCTVIICPAGAVGGVDVRGGSPGTRDTDALNPVMNREVVHAVLLSGGSAFGLDAAAGVMSDLEARSIGRNVGLTVVPNVCAAVLFDLACGDPAVRPDAAMGYAACQAAWAGETFLSGNHGAGTGASVGKARGIAHAMKGGIGQAAYRHGDLMAGAIIAVNCVGDVVDGDTTLAGSRADDGSWASSEALILGSYQSRRDFFSGNTVLGCVITNARLTKAAATKLAQVGHDGLARHIRPSHSIYDGDTIFALASGQVETTLDAVCIMAVAAVEDAIIDAITTARSIPGLPAWGGQY